MVVTRHTPVANRQLLRLPLVGVLTALVLIGPNRIGITAAAPAPAAAPAVVPAAPIREPVLFGAWVDDDGKWTTNQAAMAEVERFEASLGRKLAVNHHWYAWEHVFPTELERWDIRNGRMPLISWEPWTATLPDIIAGRYDDLIAKRAREVASLGTPVFFRWAHEMNGKWYPWSGTRNRGHRFVSAGDIYAAAYRHIHAIFQREGATNARWVWSPNWRSYPDEDWNHWSEYYPGDDVVDWIGIDGYNWGTGADSPEPAWRTFEDLMGPIYDAYADRKPVMVTETSSFEEGGSKAAWIAEMGNDLIARFPKIGAIIWFNAPTFEYDTSESSAAVFRAIVNGPLLRYRGASGP